jgi:glycosyltransferase involved in cell wall biosynthesis
MTPERRKIAAAMRVDPAANHAVSSCSDTGFREPVHVLHCPTTCGGQPQHLARVERELGLRSWSVAFDENRFGYPADEIVRGRFAIEFRRWTLLWRALRYYDVIHFNYGRTLFPPLVTATGSHSQKYPSPVHRIYGTYARALGMRDLALLRAAGKAIVVTCQGGDVRHSGYEATTFEVERKQFAVKQFDRYADRIFFLNPDLARFLPARARFFPYAHVDLRRWLPVPEALRNSRPPVLLHAPSDRKHKGTNVILEAVDQLRRERVRFEFVLVEEKQQNEAWQQYKRADILVDQLLAGWYGGLAVELMALAKPVIAYIRDEDLDVIPPAMRAELPVISATTQDVVEVLRTWLTAPAARRRQQGLAGRAYVERWHNPLALGRELVGEYKAILRERSRRSDVRFLRSV